MPASTPDILPRLSSLAHPTRGRLTLSRAWTLSDGGLALEYLDENARALHTRWSPGARPETLPFSLGGEDTRLPALAALLAREDARLVSHRPAKRAVVRFREGDAFRYGRALRPRRAARLADTMTWAGSSGVPLLEGNAPLERDDASGLLVSPELPGVPLESLGTAAPVRYIAAASSLGRALRGLHRAIPPNWLPAHAPADELSLLEGKACELRPLLPALAEHVERLLGPLAGRLTQHPLAHGVVHRDLYDRQVLVDEGGGVRLIDLDTLASGESALDVGNLLAHFDLRSLLEPHLHRVMGRSAEEFLAAYEPSPAESVRIGVYRDASRVRLAMLFALRPGREHVSGKLLNLVESPTALRAPSRAHASSPAARQADQPRFFVIGCPRSGTTLLERMLDARGDVAMTHETHWVTKYDRRRHGMGRRRLVTRELLETLYRDRRFVRTAPSRVEVEAWLDEGGLTYERLVARVFGRYASALGAWHVGDKSTGAYLRNVDRLHAICPGARVLHLVRDGRDVCLSMLDWPKAPRAAGRFAMWRQDPVATTAAWWRWQVLQGAAAGRRLGQDGYREVRFEDLVAEPEASCREVCDFLGFEYLDSMPGFAEGRRDSRAGLSPNRSWLPPTPGMRDWRRDMPAGDVELFEAIAGDALDLFGYERRHPTPSEEAASRAAERIERWMAESGELPVDPPTQHKSVTNPGRAPAGGMP